MGKRATLFKYLVALLLFGSNGIVASYISLNSYEIVFTRTCIGSIILTLIFLLSKQNLHAWKNKTHFLYLLFSGMAMGAAFLSLFEAYAQAGVSIATLAYCSGPVIVMMLSPIVFKERLSLAKVLGFIVVVLGIFLIFGKSLDEGMKSQGVFYGILAACMYALMVISNKKSTSITGLEKPMWQLISSFVTIAICLGSKQGFSLQISSEDVLPILQLGVVNTGLGCYFYFSSIGNLDAQAVALYGYIEPLSALLFSGLLLGEALLPLQWIGAIFVMAGAISGEILSQKKILLTRS